MKKLNFMNLVKLMGLIMLAAVVTFTSCKEEDDTDDPVVVLDGLYVSGSVAAYSDLNVKAMMKKTRNEVTQTERASLYELYIPLKAGAAGFNITKVAGSVKTVYGPGTAWGDITQGTTDEPKVTFQRGTVVAGGTSKFTVPADGMSMSLS